jgi:Phenylpropionate dioxygenase and related ring-hydroxylating dioxygenases, large terminal subunit
MFPKNTWYVACSSDEVKEKPFGRRICNELMVFFRNEDGEVAALEDFCPHRGAALSHGFVKEGRLICGYHGLEMGCEGRALAMPGQRVRGFPAIRAFPVVERHGFIWVWPGDAAQADLAKLPHFEWQGNPEFAYGGGLYNIACDYRLMVDNLMDLTHETYVHATSIGQAEIDETPCSTRVEGEHVMTSRFMEGVEAPPFWKANLRMKGLPDDQPVDRWQICHFNPPSHIMIEVGVALAGTGGHEAPEDCKASSWVVDFITPETDTSIWYFWGMARKFMVDDQSITDQIREGQAKVFAEDQDVLESQQRNLLAWPKRKLLMLNIDSGGIQARKIIEARLAAEAGLAMTA